MSDLISIIVPIYNSENDLEQCIESIVNQTYKNIEVLLVNDGSTDGSLNICKKWKENDERIILIDKPNGGLASSRNVGLEKARGKYIGFVDHDDYIEPEMYEVMMNDMIKYDADIVMCNSLGITDDGSKNKTYQTYDSFCIESEALINRMLKYEKVFCSSVWSKLYKRELIGDIRFVDEIVLGEDYYFNGRLYPHINKFFYDNRTLYNYRVVEGSMSRNEVNEHFFDKYKVAEKLSEYYAENGYSSKESFNIIKYSTSYEILYRLYLYGGNKKQKKKWKKIFRNIVSNLKIKKDKDYIKVFMMKYFTYLYVKFTS